MIPVLAFEVRSEFRISQPNLIAQSRAFESLGAAVVYAHEMRNKPEVRRVSVWACLDAAAGPAAEEP